MAQCLIKLTTEQGWLSMFYTNQPWSSKALFTQTDKPTKTATAKKKSLFEV